MSLNIQYDAKDFWSDPDGEHKTIWHCAPFLGGFMSGRRWAAIKGALRLRNDPAGPERNRFWHIRLLIAAFNATMGAAFVAAWIMCLDESIVKWLNEWAPGWMKVARKPQPFGNEYHTLACAYTHIITFIEMVEGKDRPPSLGPMPYEDTEGSKVAALCKRMTKYVWHTGRAIMLDSGFGTLQVAKSLYRCGLYCTMVIKKKRFWPAGVDGQKLLDALAMKPVGTRIVQEGKFDDVHLWVGAQADSKHVSIFANTFNTTCPATEFETPEAAAQRIAMGGAAKIVAKKKRRRVAGRLVDLEYGEYQKWYFFGRHAVDDHNNLRQGVFSIEDSMGTKDWWFRQFSFVFALVVINSLLAYNWFCVRPLLKKPMSVKEHRRLLSEALMSNPSYQWMRKDGNYDGGDEEDADATLVIGQDVLRSHVLKKRNPHTGAYNPATGDFKPAAKKYNQFMCKIKGQGCKKWVRTYCSCSKSFTCCYVCLPVHHKMVQEKLSEQLSAGAVPSVPTAVNGASPIARSASAADDELSQGARSMPASTTSGLARPASSMSSPPDEPRRSVRVRRVRTIKLPGEESEPVLAV